MKASDRSERRRDGLVGKYFVSFHDNGNLWKYGVVSAAQGAEHFLVRELIDGKAYRQQIFHISKMIGWFFYDTVDELISAYPSMIRRSV